MAKWYMNINMHITKIRNIPLPRKQYNNFQFKYQLEIGT